MRILIISPTQSGIGGIAQHVEGFANFLKNNNNDVDIISSENTFTIPIKGLKNPSFMISSFFKSKFQDDYDIVHAQNPISALAMKNIKAKKVLSLQGDFSQQISLLHGNTMGKISSKLEKKHFPATLPHNFLKEQKNPPKQKHSVILFEKINGDSLINLIENGDFILNIEYFLMSSSFEKIEDDFMFCLKKL